MSKQQDLMESTGHNLAERIKAIKEGGDGYMTIITKEEAEAMMKPTKEAGRRNNGKPNVQ